MDVYKSLSGLIRVTLTSADIPGAFCRIADGGMEIWNAEQTDEVTASFFISRHHFRNLKALCEKYGDSLKLVHHRGIYWKGKALVRRPVLLCGILFLLALVLYLPGRVFFVEVEGNQNVPTRLILAAAEENGIFFGASRREVRSERVKNALLEAVPQLQWAGVNTYGCVARISVRERTVAEEPAVQGGYGNIVALRDGVITSCTATKGNLLCKTGQAVKQGEVLISGYTDCGICLRVEQAEGEVYGRTIRNLSVIMPSEYLGRTIQIEQRYKISLLIGKKRINLWKDSGIQEATCDRMYEEYYMILPGGFRLPVALVVETYSAWQLTKSPMDDGTAEELLNTFARAYLTGQMVAGAIQGEETEMIVSDGICQMDGQYVCIEMIGSMQREQIGEHNGKAS